MGNGITPANDVNSPQLKLELSSKFGLDWVEIFLPIQTCSEANGGNKISFVRNGKTHYKAEHWTDKATRHKRQKGYVYLMLNPRKSLLKLPAHIIFTRYAPRKLDRFDNLPCSMKYILDACCEVITGDYRPGRADDTELINVTYKQEISKEYGVKVEIKMLKENP